MNHELLVKKFEELKMEIEIYMDINEIKSPYMDNAIFNLDEELDRISPLSILIEKKIKDFGW